MLKAKDEIRIDNLEIYAHHGVFPEENEKGQRFYLNAILYTDTRPAGLADELTLSTNYGEAARFMYDFFQKNTRKLIEAAAEQLAEEVLLSFPLVHTLDLEVRKPDAPIGLVFDSVSVKIRRGWKKVWVAVGSNLGDKKRYIEEAVNQMRENRLLRGIKVSGLLDSFPYGGVEQPDYINGVISCETLLPPKELLYFLQGLEQTAGRERSVRWGARTLDMDILLYEDVVLEETELTIPHPDMHNRDFVLRPLAELSPGLQHPLLHKTVLQLLEALEEHYVQA